MKAEHGGLALFFLVYLYVFVKHYSNTIKMISDEVSAVSAWRLIYDLASPSFEILGTLFVVFLVLLVLVLTCFRALSFTSLGLYADKFAFVLTFGWIGQRQLLFSLVKSVLLSTFLVASLVIVSRIATTPVVKPTGSKDIKGQLVYWSRRVFLPEVSATYAHTTLVAAVLLVNLLVVLMVVAMSYSGMRPESMFDTGLTLTNFSKLKPMTFTMADYARMCKAAGNAAPAQSA